METDGRRMCELLVGLGEVDLVGIEELEVGRLEVMIRSRGSRPVCEGCGGSVWSKGDRLVSLVDLPAFEGCGGSVWSKGDRLVGLVDLPAFGRPVRLWWRKRRWTCPDPRCGVGSFAEQDVSVAPERGLLTSRAGRWATAQVGRLGRTVSDIAWKLGCDWHTVNKVNRTGFCRDFGGPPVCWSRDI